ncbi:hypothetical protein MYO4S_00140 [Serratia phage 4S]|nr:hypothetical protein MYO4S_00140 [Serratia phage 4S]
MVTDKTFTPEEFHANVRTLAETLFAKINEGHSQSNVRVVQTGPNKSEVTIEQPNRLDTWILKLGLDGRVETTRVFYG